MAYNRKRDLVWRHNSFFGHVAMGLQNMNSIYLSETTTPAAKQTAHDIWLKLRLLQVQLKERVDADS